MSEVIDFFYNASWMILTACSKSDFDSIFNLDASKATADFDFELAARLELQEEIACFSTDDKVLLFGKVDWVEIGLLDLLAAGIASNGKFHIFGLDTWSAYYSYEIFDANLKREAFFTLDDCDLQSSTNTGLDGLDRNADELAAAILEISNRLYPFTDIEKEIDEVRLFKI